MAIVIETQKEVNSAGVRGYRILSIEALKKKDLPEKYTDGEPCVWKDKATGNLIMHYDDALPRWVRLDKFYGEEKMSERLAVIAEAGQRLHDINVKLAKERAEWQGKTAFVDGREIENFPPIETLKEEGRLYYRNKRGQIVPLKEGE